MKIDVTFSAENQDDLRKLIATLVAFNNSGPVKNIPSDPGETTDAPKEKKTRKAREPKATENPNEEPEPEFDFENDFNEEPTDPENGAIGLDEIRVLCNEKGTAGHGATIRKIMGAYGVSKLGDLKPAQFKTFHTEVSKLKI